MAQALNQSLATDGPLTGVLFWLWDARTTGTDKRTTDQGIVSTDSTWCLPPATHSRLAVYMQRAVHGTRHINL